MRNSFTAILAAPNGLLVPTYLEEPKATAMLFEA